MMDRRDGVKGNSIQEEHFKVVERKRDDKQMGDHYKWNDSWFPWERK